MTPGTSTGRAMARTGTLAAGKPNQAHCLEAGSADEPAKAGAHGVSSRARSVGASLPDRQ